MTQFQKTLDTCEYGQRIKQENLCQMHIQEILDNKGWVKLPYDSLWFHPTYGTRIILHALYLATKPEMVLKLHTFWRYSLWFFIGSLSTFLIGKML
jgi:hypothetical protein